MILPDEDAPIKFYFEFVDEQYSNEGFTMPLIDILTIFGSPGVALVSSLLMNFSLPGKSPSNPIFCQVTNFSSSLGLSDLGSIANETLALTQPGFILWWESGRAAEICLQRVFGTFEFAGVDDWSPFGSLVTFKVPKVKLTLDNFSFPSQRRVRSLTVTHFMKSSLTRK